MFDKLDQKIKSTKVWQTHILPRLKRMIEKSEAKIAEQEANRRRQHQRKNEM